MRSDIINVDNFKEFNREFEKEFIELKYLRKLEWETLDFTVGKDMEIHIVYELTSDDYHTFIRAVVIFKKRNNPMNVNGLSFQSYKSDVEAYKELKSTILETVKIELSRR